MSETKSTFRVVWTSVASNHARGKSLGGRTVCSWPIFQHSDTARCSAGKLCVSPASTTATLACTRVASGRRGARNSTSQLERVRKRKKCASIDLAFSSQPSCDVSRLYIAETVRCRTMFFTSSHCKAKPKWHSAACYLQLCVAALT